MMTGTLTKYFIGSVVFAAIILLTRCRTKEETTTKTTETPELSSIDTIKQVEGIRYVPFTRYPDNKLNFPAKGGTLVCKADTTFGSRAFYICKIQFDDDSCYSLSDGGYYYYRKGDIEYESRGFPSEMRGYPANWDPCPLTFRWVTVFLDGYDLLVTVEPNETGKKRHCEIAIADDNYRWGIECTQSKGPYKSKNPKRSNSKATANTFF